MSPTTAPDALDEASKTLLRLASPAQQAVASGIRDRVQNRRLRVLVAGEAKRGKSTLINRLLGRDVLPTGVVPVTAVVTTLRHTTEEEQLCVSYLDGRTESGVMADLATLVTERGNPANALGVSAVEVLLRADRLSHYPVELVDTPGTGSVFEHNTQTAQAAYDSLDAVVVVLTADPPISAAERDLLGRLSAMAVRTFVVLNKADRLAPDELAEAVDFTERVCAGSGLAPGSVWVLSALNADTGYTWFRDAFESYLEENALTDTVRALAAHLLRLGAALHDEAAVQLRALELIAGDNEATVASFTTRLTAIAARATELDDRLRATEQRLRRALDDSAAALVGELTLRARSAAVHTLPNGLDGLPAETVENRIRRVVIDRISADVDLWRSERARLLEEGLEQAVTAIDADREHQLRQLHDAARDLLGLTLTGDPPSVRLRAGHEFWYAFERPMSWEPPGAEVFRRHGPGAARRARRRVIAEVGQLVDRQVGRARADLQQRLAESVRRLLVELRRSHHDTLEQLGAALADAASLRHAGAEESGRRRTELWDRIQAIDAVAGQLRAIDEP